LSFNDSVVTFSNVMFGSGLDGGFLGSLSFVSAGSGIVQSTVVSMAPASDLNSAQPASFSLATFTFTGTGVGTTSVVFSRLELSDETGLIRLNETNGFVANTARITVIDPSRVPDGLLPLPLLAGTLALLIGGSRRWALRRS